MNDKPTPQQRVYKNVSARGYTGDWTREELIGRHILKLVEEVQETADNLTTPGADTYWPWKNLAKAAERSKVLFDARDEITWPGLEIDEDGLKKELTDCLVVVLSLAEVIGFDVIQSAIDKSTADVARGVRKP